jgi:hypothetical protein
MADSGISSGSGPRHDGEMDDPDEGALAESLPRSWVEYR